MQRRRLGWAELKDFTVINQKMSNKDHKSGHIHRANPKFSMTHHTLYNLTPDSFSFLFNYCLLPYLVIKYVCDFVIKYFKQKEKSRKY